jgi:hypothetical protein
MGVEAALGTLLPGLDYFEAFADGKGEALVNKAMHESSKSSKS